MWAILGLLKTYKIWLMAGLFAAALGTVMVHFHNDSTRKTDLANALGRVELLEIDNKAKAGQVKNLEKALAVHNQRLLDQIAADKARVDEAQTAAEDLRKQRDTIAAALAQSRKSWDEVMQNDARTRDWAIVDVPPAAFDRLRDAAGQ